jgi:tetrahydromethanopterin S-methyltransferase subunit G
MPDKKFYKGLVIGLILSAILWFLIIMLIKKFI